MFYAYLIVENSSARLFVDNAKVTDEVIAHLENAGVELRPYDTILSEIERYFSNLLKIDSKLYVSGAEL